MLHNRKVLKRRVWSWCSLTEPWVKNALLSWIYPPSMCCQGKTLATKMNTEPQQKLYLTVVVSPLNLCNSPAAVRSGFWDVQTLLPSHASYCPSMSAPAPAPFAAPPHPPHLAVAAMVQKTECTAKEIHNTTIPLIFYQNLQRFCALKIMFWALLTKSLRLCISETNSLNFSLILLQNRSVIKFYLQSIVFMKEHTNTERKWCLQTLVREEKVSTETHCVLDCTSSVWSLSFPCFSFCSCSVSLASLWSAASRRLFSSSRRDFKSVKNNTFLDLHTTTNIVKYE